MTRISDNSVVALIPILERIQASLATTRPESTCGICGCLLVHTDRSCPLCRFKLTGELK